MTVVNPKSISGINSITTGSGSDDLLTIHTNNGTERLRVDSTGATKIVTGIVTSLEATTGNITTLRAPTGIVTSLQATTGDITTLRAPTGIVTSLQATTGDITTLRAPTGIVTTFVTNTAKVGAAVTITESGIEASGIGITVANINGGKISGRRNLVINGDMRIAQRGASTTASNTFCVDRFRHGFSLAGVTVTQSQQTLSTSDSPYSEGFRYYVRESLSGAASDASGNYVQTGETRLEAQDIAQSGWNYTDPNSKLTLSFWVRSSKTMTYGWVLQTHDGTPRLFPKSFDLTANTWTKIKYSVPGNAGLQFDNDVNTGLTFKIYPYLGTTYTGGTDATWGLQSAGKYGSTNTAVTWLDGANTFDVTGLQFEVGTEATPFEHRPYGEELALCQRYYYVVADARDGSGLKQMFNIHAYSSGQFETTINYPVMRSNPSLVQLTGTGFYEAMNSAHTITFNNYLLYQSAPRVCLLYINSNLSASPNGGQAYRAQFNDSSDGAYIHLTAEI